MATNVRIVYTPEGGSKRSWVIDVENPPWDVTFNTERATGWPWEEFAEKLNRASAIAMRALIWTLRKRDEPRLDIEAVTVTFAEVDLEEVEAEVPATDEAPKAKTT